VQQAVWLSQPECHVLIFKPIREDNFSNLSSYTPSYRGLSQTNPLIYSSGCPAQASLESVLVPKAWDKLSREWRKFL